ncbi:hypothetical protein MAR_028308 [Mya arenaria]|uniref:Uncharacterized protein n=1 Tax=Mya arenaria TaxID=6604 RepID=A0ABY7DFE4_MYAAR|nr:hypothetical protein MAR_028308 [Mya arenaria]
MATADVEGSDLKDTCNSGPKGQDRTNGSARLGKRTEEEIREEHRTLRVLRKIEGHQNQIFEVVSSIKRELCRTTSKEGQEIDNHPHDQIDTSVDANNLAIEITQEGEHISELNLQLDEKKQTITKLNETVADNEEQIDVLNVEVRKLAAEKEQLSGDGENNKARIEELQKKLTDKNEKIKEIEKQRRCSSMEKEIATNAEEIDDLNREKEDLLAEVNEQRQARDNQSKIIELVEEKTGAKYEIEGLKKDIQKEREKIIELVEEKTGAKYEIKALKKDIQKEREKKKTNRRRNNSAGDTSRARGRFETGDPQLGYLNDSDARTNSEFNDYNKYDILTDFSD